MKNHKINIIMFGASGAGEYFINYLEGNDTVYNILVVADNDNEKHGKLFHGFSVISPKEIENYKYDEIVITSTFFPEISKQLISELNVDKDKVKIPPKYMTGNKKSYRPFSDKKTLELGRELLLFVTELLDNENIPYFVDHGTLLGIVRDGDLIPWDDDIDLSLEEKYMDKVIDIVKDNVDNLPKSDVLNWKTTVYYKEGDIPTKILISFDEKDNNYKMFPLSIESFIFENGRAVQELSYSEDYHYQSNDYIDYYGRKLSIPLDYEKYLDLHYGDWRKIKKNTSFLDAGNYKMPNKTYKKEEQYARD